MDRKKLDMTNKWLSHYTFLWFIAKKSDRNNLEENFKCNFICLCWNGIEKRMLSEENKRFYVAKGNYKGRAADPGGKPGQPYIEEYQDKWGWGLPKRCLRGHRLLKTTIGLYNLFIGPWRQTIDFSITNCWKEEALPPKTMQQKEKGWVNNT